MIEGTPARQLVLRGEVASRKDANDLLKAPGDAVIVRRGRLRSLALACPDGCGQTLTINLDPQTGPAWRLYTGMRGISLFPSVWREGGCKSHFIVWHDSILWFDTYEEYNEEPYDDDPSLEDRVLVELDVESFKGYNEIADKLNEIPWEVARACERLVKKGKAIAGSGKQWFAFRRIKTSTE